MNYSADDIKNAITVLENSMIKLSGNIDNDLKMLTRIESMSHMLSESTKDMRHKFALLHSPVKVSDTITCNGYSYNGYDFLVDYIALKSQNHVGGNKRYLFIASGYIIKNNGEIGSRRGTWSTVLC